MKSPIPYTYDLNTKSAQKVICVTHTDDNSVDVIQLHVVQNGALIDFSGNTIIARMVMSRTHELLSDNVVCEIDEATKDVMIPIDRKAVSTRKGLMLIEVNVRGVLPEKLTLQFPLLVRVNGSILDDAEVTSESKGTIPELLEEVREELERVKDFATAEDVFEILDSVLEGNPSFVPSLLIDNTVDQQFNPDGHWIMYYTDSDDLRHNIFDFANLPSGTSDYTDLENKPQINSHTLSGNKSSDDLGLQKKLTAGTNITLESDGTISASGGVTSYNDLTDKPIIKSKSGLEYSIDGKIILPDFSIISYDPTNKTITYKLILSGSNLSNSSLPFSKFTQQLQQEVFKDYGEYNNPPADLFTNYSVAPVSNGIWYIGDSTLQGLPVPAPGRLLNYYCQYERLQIYATDVFDPQDARYQYSGRYFARTQRMGNLGSWVELGGGSQIVSGVVNQNGTITFTDSDGNTFTTTGSSVIGADGFSPTATVTQTASGATVSITDKNGTTTANISNGADGQDYVLTNADKQEIAQMAVNLLPNADNVSY